LSSRKVFSLARYLQCSWGETRRQATPALTKFGLELKGYRAVTPQFKLFLLGAAAVLALLNTVDWRRQPQPQVDAVAWEMTAPDGR